MGDKLYCRPADILTDTGTVSLTAGTADSAYPLVNLYDRRAWNVFKATGTSCTIQTVFGGAKTLQAVALINHNLAGATVTITNGAGFSNALTIPSNAEDSLCLDPWEDYRGLALTSSTTWSVVITGAAANVAIGELLLIETLRELPVLWGAEETDDHPAIVHETSYRVRRRYSMGVRQRALRVGMNKDTFRTALVSLGRDARGPFEPWFFVLDSDVNDGLFVTIDGATVVRRMGPLQSDVDFVLVEEQKGLAL